ncbi:MAG: RimK family alpha-L-glutamate ligase [bacterium]|nr:RimK family alpha-L-glutamate ligase [bacterium]
MEEKVDLLIFTGHPRAYAIKRLVQEAKKQGLKAKIAPYRDLDFVVESGAARVFFSGVPLPVPKMAIFRTPGLKTKSSSRGGVLRRFLISQGTRVLNQESYLLGERPDKISQYFKMANSGLPIVPSQVFGSVERLEKLREYPLIIKHCAGSQGRHVFKVESLEGAKKVLDKYERCSDFLIQPFLKAGEDIRVIMLGGKALGAMKRTALPGKFLTNYSVGGRVENYDLVKDPVARELAEKVATLFKVDYSGIDLMRDEQDNWLILEINKSAQFEGFEKATGINAAKAIIEYLQKTVQV